jgi:hypothetical protein
MISDVRLGELLPPLHPVVVDMSRIYNPIVIKAALYYLLFFYSLFKMNILSRKDTL